MRTRRIASPQRCEQRGVGDATGRRRERRRRRDSLAVIDSYDRAKGDINPNYTLADGDLSRCAPEARSGGPPAPSFLTSSNGFSDPQWFGPPEDNVFLDRGGQINYAVKAESGTAAQFYFGNNDPSMDWYGVSWYPDNESLTVGAYSPTGSPNTDTDTGGGDSTDEYYRIVVDWDLNDAMAATIYGESRQRVRGRTEIVEFRDERWTVSNELASGRCPRAADENSRTA